MGVEDSFDYLYQRGADVVVKLIHFVVVVHKIYANKIWKNNQLIHKIYQN